MPEWIAQQYIFLSRSSMLNFCHISVKLAKAYMGFKPYASFMLTEEGQTMPNLNKVKTAGDTSSAIKIAGAKGTNQNDFLKKCE